MRQGAPDRLDPDRLLHPLADYKSIGLAVSGGADSLALLLLVKRWITDRAGAPAVFVYSVDHRLRPHAAAEADMVARLATGLGFAARILIWEGDKPQTGIQAAARAARYRLIARAMAADGAQVLLTAHHSHDQAETVLMRMAHGSGVNGLGGMRAFAEHEAGITLFRPLLDVEPQALRAVVADAGLVPASDPSNDDTHYERVRWRALLPHLAEVGLTAQGLGRMARRLDEVDAALTALARDAIATGVVFEPLGGARLARAWLAERPVALAQRILSVLLQTVGGGTSSAMLEATETLAASVLDGDRLRTQTLRGVLIAQKGDQIVLRREPWRKDPPRLLLAGGTQGRWDNRFDIAVPPGPPAQVTAADLSVEAARLLLGSGIPVDAISLATAPLVRGATGQVLALGTRSVAAGVSVVPILPARRAEP